MKISGPDGTFRGEVIDGTYFTMRTNPIHVLRLMNSYGISVDTLALIGDEPYSVRVVVIEETSPQGRCWRISPLRDWTDSETSRPFTDRQTNDDQRHIAIERMTVAQTKEEAEEAIQTMKDAMPKKREPVRKAWTDPRLSDPLQMTL